MSNCVSLQVAQLWQRDRAKHETFYINVQRYSQNHAQNWIFGPPYLGIRGNIGALSEILNTRHLVAEFHRETVVLLVKQRIRVSEPLFGKGAYSSLARWKADSRLSIGYN